MSNTSFTNRHVLHKTKTVTHDRTDIKGRQNKIEPPDWQKDYDKMKQNVGIEFQCKTVLYFIIIEYTLRR